MSVEYARTRLIRGFRSRNKAAVGEPAAGSLMYNISVIIYLYLFYVQQYKTQASNSGSLGLVIDEERETKRY